MYLSTIDKPRTASWKGLSGNVFALGTVSLITDVSSEMVAAILPLYLVARPPAQPGRVRR